MTVKELMEKFATMPQDTIVATWVDFDYDRGGYMEATNVYAVSTYIYTSMEDYSAEQKEAVILSISESGHY